MRWLRGGLVYETGPQTFRRLDLAIDGERIVAVAEPDGSPSDEETVDATGLYLLPGLIDCHVHLGMRAEDADPSAVASRPDATIGRDMAEAAERTLRSGVTAVREVGGWNYLEMALRAEIERGSLPGPRLFLSGRLLSVPTGAVVYYPGMYEVATGPDQVREAARAQLVRGADQIKVMATGAMLSPQDEDAGEAQFTLEELQAVVEEATAAGKPVAAHAHAAAGIHNAVRAGVSSIEHGTFADEAALELMNSRGTFLVPTLCATTSMLRDATVRDAMPEHLRARLTENQGVHQDAVRRAHRMGVRIAMGTDAGTPGNDHGANADEVVAMVEEAGLTPQQSIRAATAGAALLLRREADLGSLAQGRFADIIGCLGDPTKDIAQITRVVFVMKGGRVLRDDR